MENEAQRDQAKLRSLTIPEVVASVAPRDPALSNHMLNEVRVGSFYFPMLLRPSPFHA
jgi:hypothetical protein